MQAAQLHIVNLVTTIVVFAIPTVVHADIRPLAGTYSTLKVKRGETLQSIARREDVNRELLASINHLRNGHVRPGQTLTLPTLHILPRQPKEGIVLNIPERQVYVFRGGQMRAVYPVAVGKASWPTETGQFSLASKAVNPVWKPTKEMVEREDIKDDPVPAGKDNPVGDRWMGWSKKGYGFHSTTAPASVGSAVSHGCVRLYPESAHKMFDLVKEGETIYSIYEPITVGQREGKFFLSVFPDIYHRNLVSQARAKAILQKEGLLSRVNMNEVARIVRLQQGYPQPLHTRTTDKRHAANQKPARNAKPSKQPAKAGPAHAGTSKPKAPTNSSHGKTAATPAARNTGKEFAGFIPPPEQVTAARRQGALLLARYRSGQLKLLNEQRDLAQLEQLARQGYLDDPNKRPLPLSPQLTKTLARLVNHTSPRKPLVLLSLYRPLSLSRPNEPHGRGLAADISAFDGHRIDNTNPAEAVAGVVALLQTLPAGKYRLGLPKPPETDPAAFLAPPERPSRWPFFPAPLPSVTQMGATTVVVPYVANDRLMVDPRGRFRAEILRWENERGAPLSALGEPRLRRAFVTCSHKGVEVTVAFPDAADHLHLDVVPAELTLAMPQGGD